MRALVTVRRDGAPDAEFTKHGQVQWKSSAEKNVKKISAHYHPVGEETFALLKDVLHGVCFGQIGKTVIALTDGTALTLSTKGVRRVAKVDLELGQ